MEAKVCPYCDVEMFHPRADLITFGTKQEIMNTEYGELPINTIGEVKIGDTPLFTFSDSKTKVEYYDFQCPKCDVILFYGNKKEETE